MDFRGVLTLHENGRMSLSVLDDDLLDAIVERIDPEMDDTIVDLGRAEDWAILGPKFRELKPALYRAWEWLEWDRHDETVVERNRYKGRSRVVDLSSLAPLVAVGA